jgi:hypothetical protein
MPVTTTTALAIGALAVSAAGTVKSIQAQKKAAKKQDKLANLSARRDRRRAIREARLARATTLNTGAQVGAGESSGVAGGIASTGSQLGSNLGFSTQSQALGKDISRLNSRAALFAGIAGVAGSVSSFAASFPNQQKVDATVPSAPFSTGFNPRTGGGAGQPGRPF